MDTKNYKIFIVFLFFNTFLFSQHKLNNEDDIQFIVAKDNSAIGFKKPTTWRMFKDIPKDILDFGKFTIQKENLKWDALAVGTTIAIIPFDQKIIEDADKLGEKLGGWNEDARYNKIFNTLSIIPTNIPSAVYYVGNGGTTLLLSGVFYGIGKIGKDDYRALNTSSELVEALFSAGILTQSIKRITGRESPVAATKDGGAWNPFPSFNAFQKNTPSYDAMPSGHMTTYIATVTIIATNYPELKWIKPVGYTLGGLMAFNMVSGKVHWASDYPLAILMGYVIGKNIANRRIIKKETQPTKTTKKTTYKSDYNFIRINNINTVGVRITF